MKRFMILIIVLGSPMLLFGCHRAISQEPPNDISKLTPTQQVPTKQNSITPKPQVDTSEIQPLVEQKVSWYPRPHKNLIEQTQYWGKNVVDSVFIDSTNGWLLASSDTNNALELYKTTNGGDTWVKISDLNTYFPNSINRGWISFLDNNTGWFTAYSVLAEPYLYLTQDGGYTWKPVKLVLPTLVKQRMNSNTAISLFPVQFFTSKDGFFILDTAHDDAKWRYLFITHDSGKSWSDVHDITEDGHWTGNSGNMSWDFTTPSQSKVIIENNLWISDPYLINWNIQK